mgnify:FL=1
MSRLGSAFSLEEIKSINSLIEHLYDESLTLEDCMDLFTNKLREQIYFDKSDFMFFRHNPETNLYEMQSFAPINWSEGEVESYIETYMHMDDVLPILATPQEIAFRNSDIFCIAERKKTRYYREFVQTAQLEISIDANIPLPQDYNTYAILGLFRNTGKKEFTLKELEIVKMYQKHLSKVFEKKLANANSNDDSFLAFDNFESLGVCILDSELKLVSFNTTFKNFASDRSTIHDSAIGQQVRKIAEQLSGSPAKSKLGPISAEINNNTFLIEVSRYNHKSTKYICIVYPLSNLFLTSMTSLKDSYRLSNREFEILYLMLKNGMTNEEIANYLFISVATVKRHISTAYQKLGINNQKQLLTLLKII